MTSASEKFRTARLHWVDGKVTTTKIAKEGEPPMILQDQEWDLEQNRIQHLFQFRVRQSLDAEIIEYDELVAGN